MADAALQSLHEDLAAFIRGDVKPPQESLPAVSLFSNGGVGDLGYALAGFNFVVHAERDAKRCDVLQANFPRSRVVRGDLHETWPEVVEGYRSAGAERPALLAASPPCQGMSSTNQSAKSNAWRHEVRDDDRNYLYDVIPRVAEALRPRVIVVENVPGILVTGVRDSDTGRVRTVARALLDRMPGYQEIVVTAQMADYGVPQSRLRTFFVFAARDERWFSNSIEKKRLPFPAPTRGPSRARPWITLRKALRAAGFSRLDASSAEEARDDHDPYHFVPIYEPFRYQWVSLNPPYKGRSCFENLACAKCGKDNAPKVTAKCRRCGLVLPGVPRLTDEDGGVRAVKGRRTAYRRMHPDRPAATITTASGHLGSDNTIHPWENRVLSIRECAFLQTVPATFRLHKGERVENDLARGIVGEAIPPWFTYQLGSLLRQFLDGGPPPAASLLPLNGSTRVVVDKPHVAAIAGSRPVSVGLIPALAGPNGNGQQRVRAREASPRARRSNH